MKNSYFQITLLLTRLLPAVAAAKRQWPAITGIVSSVQSTGSAESALGPLEK